MKLTFVIGGAIRRVHINGRVISLESAELSYMPFSFDLDKLDTKETKEKMSKMKMSNEDIKTLKELHKLGSEDAIAKDIIKDFQKTGWRLVKRE